MTLLRVAGEGFLGRWPARVTLPLMLLALYALVILALLWLRLDQAQADARREQLAALAEISTLTAGRLESYAERGDDQSARGVLTRLGLYSGVQEAWLLGPDGEIRFGLPRGDATRGRPQYLERLSVQDAALLSAALEGSDRRRKSITADIDRSSLVLVEPVLISAAPPLRGQLVILATSRWREAEAEQRVYWLFQLDAALLLAAVFLMWWLLRRRLFERSRQLALAAASLGAGGERRRSGVRGSDELGVIGEALDLGVAQLDLQERLLALNVETSRLLARSALPFRQVCERLLLLPGCEGVALFRQQSTGLVELASAGAALPPADAVSVELVSAPAVDFPELRLRMQGEAAGHPLVREALQVLLQDLSQALARADAEQARKQAERREQLAMEAAELGSWTLQAESRQLQLSPLALSMLGMEAEAPSADLLQLLRGQLHPEDVQRLDAVLQSGQECPGLIDEEFRVRVQGRWCWRLARGTVVSREADGARARIAGVLIDIDARHQAEAALRLASEVFDKSRVGILICDADGLMIDVNPAFEQITGYRRDEALGSSANLLSSGRHGADFYRAMWAALLDEGRWEGEIWNRRHSGEIYPQWLSITRVDDLAGRPLHYIGQFIETSDRKAFESRIEFLGAHDLLTELPRRERLMEALQVELDVGLSAVALLHLDIDRFRQINESLGYAAGDELLRRVARRLRRNLPPEAWASRISADEFLVLAPAGSPGAARALAEQLHAALAKPLELRGQLLVPGVSIGVALGPDDAASAEGLAAAAELALAAAQAAGHNTVVAYAPSLSGHSAQALQLESQLRLGLDRGEFFVVYQPQVSLHDGRLEGLEALLRWRHPTRGLVSPAEFIPLAEVTGLIIQLGDFVLREACQAASRLRACGLPAVPVSVNVSALQFRRADFEAGVQRALDAAGLPCDALELELTESVLMEQADSVLQRLDALRALGLKLAIDDFGTGFSSLAYLGRLRPDRLKIDQSFVRGMCDSASTRGVVKAILALAEELGLSTVAEGVETREQAAVLAALGCATAQGWLYARALPEDALAAGLGPDGFDLSAAVAAEA